MKKILICSVFFFSLQTFVFAQYELKFAFSPFFTHSTTSPSNIIDDIYTYNVKSKFGNVTTSPQFSIALYKKIKPDVSIGISAGIRNTMFLYIDTNFEGKSSVGLNETQTVIGEFQIRERVFNALLHIEKRFLAKRKLFVDGSVGFSRFNSNSLLVLSSTTLLKPEKYQEEKLLIDKSSLSLNLAVEAGYRLGSDNFAFVPSLGYSINPTMIGYGTGKYPLNIRYQHFYVGFNFALGI